MRPQPGAHSGMVKIAGGYLKRKLGHWLVQADSLGQHAVKHIHIEEILAFTQQAGVKLKLGGIQLAGHGGAQVDRVGNAQGVESRKCRFSFKCTPANGSETRQVMRTRIFSVSANTLDSLPTKSSVSSRIRLPALAFMRETSIRS